MFLRNFTLSVHKIGHIFEIHVPTLKWSKLDIIKANIISLQLDFRILGEVKYNLNINSL